MNTIKESKRKKEIKKNNKKRLSLIQSRNEINFSKQTQAEQIESSRKLSFQQKIDMKNRRMSLQEEKLKEQKKDLLKFYEQRDSHSEFVRKSAHHFTNLNIAKNILEFSQKKAKREQKYQLAQEQKQSRSISLKGYLSQKLQNVNENRATIQQIREKKLQDSLRQQSEAEERNKLKTEFIKKQKNVKFLKRKIIATENKKSLNRERRKYSFYATQLKNRLNQQQSRSEFQSHSQFRLFYIANLLSYIFLLII